MLKASWLRHVATGAHAAGGIHAPAAREPTAKTGQAGRGQGWWGASRQDGPREGTDRQTDRHGSAILRAQPALQLEECWMAPSSTSPRGVCQDVPPAPAPALGQGVRGEKCRGRGRWLQEGDPSVLFPWGSSLAAQGCSASLLCPVLASASRGCRCLFHGSSALLAFPFLKIALDSRAGFSRVCHHCQGGGAGPSPGAWWSEGQRRWQPHALPSSRQGGREL